MEQAIKISNLKKTFANVTALEEINLIINKGEMFGLVGPDGAGKTTLIKILCNLLAPDIGNISILDMDLKKNAKIIKNKIGYLSQKFSLYGDLTIDENIEFFAEIHNIRNYKARREQLLEFTRLTNFRTRLAEKLSGGMKQKLALACTLIHKPEIIFLDEPTTGVDPVSRREFWKILSMLWKDGTTIVMSTPYLDEAERCNRIALFNNGKIISCDTPNNIKSQMTSVVLEIVCEPIRSAYNLIKNKTTNEVQLFGDRINLVITEKNKTIEEIIQFLIDNNIKINDYHQINPSLENVFILMIESSR